MQRITRPVSGILPWAQQAACWVAAALAAGAARAGDWPQFRYDAGRTAASPEELPEQLHLQWFRRLPPPQPAYPLEVRLRYDAAYEPVAAEGLLFVPSMTSDSVTALDLETGRRRWRFFTEGPVRFAPAYAQGRLYVASDDGWLYCLAAREGRLLWKFRGAPEGRPERTLLGNGRLISLWPVRGGPVVADGVVYFAAGLWPGDGVAIHAVDAVTGRTVWSATEVNHIPTANMDHGISQFAGITPQGYLAVAGDYLIVPCGAQLAAVLDRATGRLARPYNMGWGGRVGLPKGSWFVAAAGKYLSHSGDLYDMTRPTDERFQNPRGRPDFKSRLYAGGFTRLLADPTNQKALGDFQQPVLTTDVLYDNVGGLRALDLTSVELVPRPPNEELPAYRRNDTYPDWTTGRFHELWRLGTPLRPLLRAGGHLYLGGPGQVAAVRLPPPGGRPEMVWQTTLDGSPQRALAADGRLVVTTGEGGLYAFGGREQPAPLEHPWAVRPADPADPWAQRVQRLLRATQSDQEGYAVVFGAGEGRLLEQLARQSRLHVIAIQQDEAAADALRRRLDDLGLYGRRIAIRVGDPWSFPLPPYLARLVVVPPGSGFAGDAAQWRAVARLLRPYGGTAWLAGSPGDAAQPAPPAGLDGRFVVRSSKRGWLLRRPGPLDGAADWTHPLADAGNTNASADRRVRPPLRLLWFDASLRWHRKPGSTLVCVAHGRIVVKAERLHAIDVYTGRPLWTTALPIAHRADDQLAVAEDAIYVAGGGRLLVVDPATGRIQAELSGPEGLAGPWKNLRLSGEHLVAQRGEWIACLNRRTGAERWRARCSRAALSVAVGGGKAFCAELPNPRRGPEQERQAVKTRAWDLETGRLLWERPGGSPLIYAADCDRLVTDTAVLRGQDGSLAAKLPESESGQRARPAPLLALGDRLLFGTLESYQTISLTDGQPLDQPFAWVRRGCTTMRASATMITTRYRANSACIDLATRRITPLWNVRPGCYNSLFPADGVLNAVNITGGCECNYSPTSQGYISAEDW